MAKPLLSSIPYPGDLKGALRAIRSLKENVDVLLGRSRVDPINAAVSWRELVQTGLITEDQARAIIAGEANPSDGSP